VNDWTRIVAGMLAWTAVISGLHASMNVDWSSYLNDRLPESERKLNVAYLPVT
jgi:hypothetical protein